MHPIAKTLLCAALAMGLAGCVTTSPLLQQLGVAPQDPQTLAPGAAAAQAAATSPVAPSATPSEAVQSKPFDTQAAVLDLTKTDGKVCAATSDAGLLGNASVMLRLGAVLGATYAANDLTDGKYQAQLDQLKPALKQLSMNVLWLPVEAESLLGDVFFKANGYTVATPTSKNQKAVAQEIVQAFSDMKDYARTELQSPLDYRLTFVRVEAGERSMHMLPGGHLIVPMAVVDMLVGQRDAVHRAELIRFMLAHEMSHALRRHTTKMAQVNLVDGLLVADKLRVLLKERSGQMSMLANPSNLGRLFEFSSNTLGTMVGSVCATRRWFNELEKNQELEADVCGAKLLHEAGRGQTGVVIDPLRAMVRYDEMKSRQGKGRGHAHGHQSGVANGAQPLFGCYEPASHPELDDRRANLEAYWRALNPGYTPTVAVGPGPGARPQSAADKPGRSGKPEVRGAARRVVVE